MATILATRTASETDVQRLGAHGRRFDILRAVQFSRRKVHGFTISGASVAAGFLIWASFINPRDASYFPTPSDVLIAAKQITFHGYAGGTLLMHTLYSVKLAFMGFLLAIAVAIPMGIVMGTSERASAALDPLVSIIRPIPPLAWVPIAIIWFGLGEGAKLFVVCFTAFVPALINTVAGVRGVDPTLIAAARVHGGRGWRLLWEVIIPAALPMIFTGLRVSLQAAWMTLVAAELVGAFFGLGRVLSIAAQDIYPAMIVVAMACVALTGASINIVLVSIEHIALPWKSTSL